MKNRLPVLGVLVAVLVVLTGAAVYSLVLLGSGVLAVIVAVGGLAAAAGVVAAYLVARDVEAQVPDLPAPPAVPAVPAAPPFSRKQGFRLREARPGEIPAPYLAAVLKGAEATRAALKARDSQQARETRH